MTEPSALDPLEMLLDAARYIEDRKPEWAKAARAAVAAFRAPSEPSDDSVTAADVKGIIPLAASEPVANEKERANIKRQIDKAKYIGIHAGNYGLRHYLSDEQKRIVSDALAATVPQPEGTQAREALELLLAAALLMPAIEPVNAACKAAARALAALPSSPAPAPSHSRQDAPAETPTLGAGGAISPVAMKLQAQKPDGGDWFDIQTTQLRVLAKQGYDVRATEAPADLDRLSSIWDDVRTRLNVHRDYCGLGEAIDKLLGRTAANE